jgi:dihydrolipoamide dehydrogenase
MAERYDLTVVGGGPGGYVAAIRGAQLGLRVALVEREHLGGVCLNWGCIPTKALLASADALTAARRAEEFGVKIDGARADVPAMFERKDRVVAKLRSGVESLLKKRDVLVVAGEGTLREPGVVEVAGGGGTRTLEAKSVILATGSAPLVPLSFPYDGRHVITSREALTLSEPPDSLVVIGAGAVGCEFAGFFAALGVRVTLVEMLPEILPGEDVSAARLLRSAFRKQGVDVRPGTKVDGIEVRDGRVATTLADGETVESARVLLAMGRRPSIGESGIQAMGIAVERGAVTVDDRMRTSVEGVYAIGDLVGGWLLAHVASREGIVAASQAAGRDVRMNYLAVPRCTFTHPEIASVGLTEADAKEGGIELKVGRFPFGASGKALALGEAQGYTKVLSDAASGRVVGGVVAGPHASDLVHELALAVEARLDVDVLAQMIHAHPTLAEAVMEAAEAVEGMSVHSI